MEPYNGGNNNTNGNSLRLSSSDLQDLQELELQRLHQEVQARLAHHLGGTAGQPQMQNQQQRYSMGQQQMNNQGAIQRSNSLQSGGGMDNNEMAALFLLQQQQQQRRGSSGAMNLNANTSSQAMYSAGMGNSTSSFSSGGMNMNAAVRRGSENSVNSNISNANAMQALLLNQQRMGSSSASSMSPSMDRNLNSMQSALLQQASSNPSNLLSALSNSRPQMAAANSSDQLLMQQQLIMADLKRQLARQGSGNIGSNAGAAHRRTSSSSSASSSAQQKRQMFQMQQRQNSNSIGGLTMQQQGQPTMSRQNLHDRRLSNGSVEPISLSTFSMAGAQQQPMQAAAARRGSGASYASMGQMSSSSGGGEMSSLLQQQQLQQQQLVSGMSRSGIPPVGMDRRETSIDSIATVKRSNQSRSVGSMVVSASASSRGQQFMEGTFEGGWQSNADLPERREVIYSIVKLIEQTRPGADKATQRLPQMAKRLEEHLYRTARSKEEYLDRRTLKTRLQNVAHRLESSRSSSVDGNATNSRHVQSAQGGPELTEVERRTNALKQQLQQMQQLQSLQQQGAINDYLSQQANVLQMQQAGQFGDSSVGMQRSGTASLSQGNSREAAGRTGILKSTGKYQDPGSDRRHKNTRLKQQQQRLLLLRHASKCKAGPTCKTKHCAEMVELWNHLKGCRTKECSTPHCLSSRCILNHYRKCKSAGRTSSCEICAPVMQRVNAKSKRHAEEADVASHDNDSPDAKLPSSPFGPVSSPSRGFGSQETRRKLEELEATQQKLHEQQVLLRQLKEQQAHVLEQQEQLRQKSEHVHPNTQQGMELRQQQDLLQQLLDLFQQQQVLLQKEVNESMAPLEGESRSFETQNGSRPSSRSTSRPRGRGAGKGKRLSAVGAVSSELGSASSEFNDMKPIASRKRAVEASSDVASVDEGRSAKVAKVESRDQAARDHGNAKHTTSLIHSMPIAAVQSHLASLNDKLNISPRTVTHKCLPVVQRLLGDKFGWVFRDAVDPVALGLPDYYDIVKSPMHLSLVEEKLRKGEYNDLDSFARDVRLIFDNAILYNGDDSEVGEMASMMLRHFEKDLRNVQKAIDRDQRKLHGNDACILCGQQRRLFQPITLYCNGTCGMQRIRRNAMYYTDHTKMNHWCPSCFAELSDEELILLEDGSEVRKSALQKFKNDGLPEEPWVQCDECSGWVHQICALFNGRRNKNAASYQCPKCSIEKRLAEEIDTTMTGVKGAKDLPHCKMSEAIECGMYKTLALAYEERAAELGVDVSQVEKADGLFVRVVSNMEKKHVVRDAMYKRYGKDGAPSDFPVRSKCIALFQTIDGVDVILFAMYVYEYDGSCPLPNRRRVYISYLDSIFYFRPKCYRTIVYHSLMVEYLRFVKQRGFHTAHIWSCPPADGDDYVFYSHPKEQLVPREEMLRQWYHRMLDKAMAEGIVLETRTLYDEYFSNDGTNAPSGSARKPTCLPYFEGDYIPGEIENIIKDVGDTASSSDGQDEVMRRLGERLYNMRENFMVVRMLSRDFVAAVDNGEDVTDWVDTGDASNKKIKIGSKDSNCLSQLPAEHQKVLTGMTEALNAGASDSKNTTEFSPAQIAGDKNELNENRVDSDVAKKQDETTEIKVAPSASKEQIYVKEETEDISGNEHINTLVSTDVKQDVGSKQRNDENCRDQSDEKANASSETVKVEIMPDNAETSSPTASVSAEAGVKDSKSDSAEEGANDSKTVSVEAGTKDSKVDAPAESNVQVDDSVGPQEDSDAGPQPLAADAPASADDLLEPVPLSSIGTGEHEEAMEPLAFAVLRTEEQEMVTKADPSTKASVVSLKRGIAEIGPALSRHFASARGNPEPVGTTEDKDEPQEMEMFESRQQFLNYCQANHFQFDELRRAKHSSMMVLFQLHNPSAPMFLQQCGACYREITHGTRYHCNDCSNFDLCQDCFEPVTTGLWAKRDSRFTHNKRHTFVSIDMEAPADTQKSRDERARSLKLHLKLLTHAATCNGPPECSLNNCKRMKELFEHVNTCEVTYRKGCKPCLRLLSLLTMHARMCTVRGSCPLPFCDRIRERNKRRRQQQQLMDDRRRKAQNALYGRRAPA